MVKKVRCSSLGFCKQTLQTRPNMYDTLPSGYADSIPWLEKKYQNPSTNLNDQFKNKGEEINHNPA